jgi:hypothetical protein
MWKRAQAWEIGWWGDCANTYGEEEKQLVYARCMGLVAFHDGKSPYNFDMHGKSVIDLGAGPCSLLLKCVNCWNCKAVDPLTFPAWIAMRYRDAGIRYEQEQAERITDTGFDEAWIYNVLQHVEDPELVIRRAQRAAKVVRVFEWLGIADGIGHLHSLTRENLNNWLGGEGKVEQLAEHGCNGLAYYGIFPGRSEP